MANCNSPTIFDLANAFLSIEAMSNKKLQKMCYYAQAWHLVFKDVTIVKASFKAWVHGPANPSLYRRYKKFGFNAIPKYKNVKSLPVDLLAFAREVWRAYGHLDAYELENLSHSEAPWKEARDTLRPWEPCTNVISKEVMKKYYRSMLLTA